MIKHFIAFMLLASPCLAGMGIGGFPYPGPGVAIISAPTGFCDGSDLFCTSWETGTDVLNTGATGNEDTLSTSDTTNFVVSTANTIDGGRYLYGQNTDYLNITNGGGDIGPSCTFTGSFRIDSENANPSNLVLIYDSSSYYTVLTLIRDYDSNLSDNLVPIIVKGKFTSSTLETVSPLDVSLALGTIYHYSMVYNTTTNIARVIIYNPSNGIILDTGDIAVTINLVISSVKLAATGYGYVSHDAVKVNP